MQQSSCRNKLLIDALMYQVANFPYATSMSLQFSDLSMDFSLIHSLQSTLYAFPFQPSIHHTPVLFPPSIQEEARVPVPDWRVDWLHETYKSSVKIPAFLTCTDIAGLTKGASTGAGLGNAFLSHVRAVDGIFQVIRMFPPFSWLESMAEYNSNMHRRLRRCRSHPCGRRRRSMQRYGHHPE